ncbi:peptide chain release factor aRF-1 [Methanopyrus kandleri]|uniref:Peptide chain release factor subunit 1 n=2 Tax=Methanopyrus kandleri TaxID=2320 RepID=RF1_METKA|nr:peptide chain release factor aRF-1 [Methanopyrus kandleri]Q8TXB5.1 RecName: Full=Peptide chain release factor subunit 1; AltName: Full=Translation termination factor aRF1 [Methanopyrus kandleri AV19]AAM01973.1 Peptide chain release factor eRF1 [Methanopyrus kandleri AV19]HII70014.1 peptide chain release factor 1 [Methanopyrus kandleri]
MAESSTVERYRFRKMIERLENLRGQGTELITIYIPPENRLSDVIAQMREEYSQASNIKSKRTRKNVQSAIEVVMQRLKMVGETPENGLVVLVGTVQDGTKEKMVAELIEPPEPVDRFIYRCDSKFYLEPLKEYLEEKDVYGILVMDRREATIGLVKGKRIEPVKRLTSDVPGKHKAGGQSQRRFDRLIEHAAHEFYQKVGEAAREAFEDVKDLKGIIVGGPGPTKEEFLDGDYLPKDLKEKVLTVVDVGNTDESGLREALNKAEEALKEAELVREKRLVRKFMEEAVNGELAAYGEEVDELLKMGAVEVLLVSEDLEGYKVILRCPECGYENIVTVKEKDEAKKYVEECPECGEAELNVEEIKDIVDYYVELAEQMGSNVEIISTETEEGAQFYNAFRGLGALLRFRPK